MRWRVLILVIYFCLLSMISEAEGLPSAPPPKQLSLSLDQCIALALERNAKVEAGYYGIEAATAQHREVDALFWPVLDYQYRAAPVPANIDRALDSFFRGQVTMFNSLHLGLGVPFTTFGQIRMAKQLAAGGIEAARVSQQKDRAATVFQVRQLFYGIQLAAEIQKLLRNAIEEISKKISTEEVKEIPDESPINLIKLKSYRNEMEKRLTEAAENDQLARDGLRVQLNLADEESFELESLTLKPEKVTLSSLEAYVQASRDHRPDAQLLNLGVETKERQYRLEKLKLMPRAGVGGFFDIGGTTSSVSGLRSRDDFSDPFNFKRAGVGLQIEGKIDFHGAAARIEKARAEHLKAQLEGGIARRALELEGKRYFLQVERLRDNVKRARRAQSLAQQMLFLAKSNVELGVDDRGDVVEGLKMLLLSRGEYFKAVFDYNVALADLERVVSREAFATLTPPSSGEEFELFDGQTEAEWGADGAEEKVEKE